MAPCFTKKEKLKQPDSKLPTVLTALETQSAQTNGCSLKHYTLLRVTKDQTTNIKMCKN